MNGWVGYNGMRYGADLGSRAFVFSHYFVLFLAFFFFLPHRFHLGNRLLPSRKHLFALQWIEKSILFFPLFLFFPPQSPVFESEA